MCLTPFPEGESPKKGRRLVPATHHYEDKKNNCFRLGLSALGIAAVAAVFAAVFKDELLATVGAFLFLVDDTIGHVFLQGTGNAVFPCVDAFFLHIEVLHQFDYVLDRHTVAQDA